MSFAIKNYVNLSAEDVIKELIYDFVGEIPIRVERFSIDGLNSELYIYDPSTGRHYNATVEGICQLKEERDELYERVDVELYRPSGGLSMNLGRHSFDYVTRNKELCREYERVTNKFIRYKNLVRESRAFEQIEKVIFNDPATIVFWSDGTKTVVQAHDEKFDKEKGLAMAIAKKTLGNKGNYFEIFKKYCGEV